ncbi:hypothetical protein, partial [Enterocloster asparagiformis]
LLLFFVSSNFYILAHLPAFVNNFFKNFFVLLLISQQQLYYVTTVAFVCQQLFSFSFQPVGLNVQCVRQVFTPSGY